MNLINNIMSYYIPLCNEMDKFTLEQKHTDKNKA